MSKKKICFICSSGGHLEQIRQLDSLKEKYDCFYIVPRTKATEKISDRKYLLDSFDRKNKVRAAFKFSKLFVQEKKIFNKENPDIIITTGAGICIPMCYLGTKHHKNVIYIESFAKLETANKTGMIIYRKHWYTHFVVQWESMLKVYPDAECWGWIY